MPCRVSLSLIQAPGPPESHSRRGRFDEKLRHDFIFERNVPDLRFAFVVPVTSEPEIAEGLRRVGIALEVDCGDMGPLSKSQRDVLAGEPLRCASASCCSVCQPAPSFAIISASVTMILWVICGGGGIVFPGVGSDNSGSVVQGPVPV